MQIQRKLWLLAGSSALLFGMVIAPAQASLVGDTVNLTYYFPDSSTVYSNYGNQTVPTAAYDLSNAGAGVTLTVGATQVFADLNPGFADLWNPTGFNGWVLTDLTNSDITGVTIDSQTNFGLTNADISWTSDSISVNWSGLIFGNGGLDSNFTLDVSTSSANSVPEPTPLALAGLGLLAFAASRRKAKQK